MGISERKEREKEELRNRILSVAENLFLEHGYDATSIRNIAEQIEYSPTTIYLYYKDKDSIFHALHSRAFAKLNTRFETLVNIQNPFERLIEMGKIYISFALENKELYDLMFIMKAPIKVIDGCDEGWEEGMAGFNFLKANVSACMQQGYLKSTDAEHTAFVIWSTVHGMCSLEIRNRCEKVISPANRAEIIHKGYENFIEMLRLMH